MLLTDLNKFIASHNPFVGAGVEKSESIWKNQIPDVEVHNEHVTDIIRVTIKRLATQDKIGGGVQTLAVSADVGMGKTQLFSRVRRKFFDSGKINFAYLNAGGLKSLDSGELSKNIYVYSWFRKGLVSDLGRLKASGITQWQEIAAFLTSQAIQKDVVYPRLIKNFNKTLEKSLSDGLNLFKKISDRVIKRYPRIDPYLIRATLWTMSSSYGSIALRWLAGEDLDESSANIMQLPSNSDVSLEKRESDSVQFNTQILKLASLTNPMVVGIDEMEDVGFISEDGFGKVSFLMSFIKSLYESIESDLDDSKGVLILSSLIVGDSLSEYLTLGGIQDRISTASDNQIIRLNSLNPEIGLEIVRRWLKERLYEPFDLEQPDPFYPFEEDVISDICKLKPTLRDFLKWCSKEFKEKTKINEPPKSDDEIFKDELEKVKQMSLPLEVLGDSGYIANLLYFGFTILKVIKEPIDAETPNGETIRQLEIQEISTEIPVVNHNIEPRLSANGSIDFKVAGHDSDGEFCIGVKVCQAKHHHTIQADLKRLVLTERFGFTRSCLVRSQGLPLNGRKMIDMIGQLQMSGGEIVSFTPAELEPLWQLYLISSKAHNEDIEFKDRSINDLLIEFETHTFLSNPILLEILSSVPEDKQAEINDVEEDEEVFNLLVTDDESSDEDSNEFDDLVFG